ncbi:DUF1992 domain-containing protein [Plantactinospora sp. WMMC1484]|uniref:DnaJ family domain-containing protein n=1 Tax=Plantactinospora sp. WMMC1484 TaxID=3404122 RepID=UPI003BF4F686
MPGRHESRVERQIREAQERGEFDNLPGAGRPLPGHGGTYDENWWIRDWVRRENLTGIGPTSLKIRKEAEELPERLDRESSEPAVRALVTALNERIVLARRGLVDGPPVVLATFDIERVVAAWRERRARRPGTG